MILKKNKRLAVDMEWADGMEVEPGTNEAFLFSKTPFRDAMIAAAIFNIFTTIATG